MKKNLFILIILGMFLFSLFEVYALEPIPMGGGGGGGRIYCYDNPNICTGDYNVCNKNTGDCMLNESSFTGCLVKNCRSLCGERGFDNGYYYKEDKCWCEKYEKSSFGVSIYDDGWVRIKECTSKQEVLNKYIAKMIITASIFLFLILLVILFKNKKKVLRWFK